MIEFSSFKIEDRLKIELLPIKNVCQDSDRNSPSKLVIETLREELRDRNLCLTIFGQVLNYKFINKKNKTMCFKWNFLKNIYTRM